MAAEPNDKLSIKNMVFTRAMPVYKTPVPTNDHKLYACTDCGDKFILKSSYEYHMNRKSVLIKYMCRRCNCLKIFKNRCNLLNHIRSHAFKTATINVNDLKVEVLPMSDYQYHPRAGQGPINVNAKNQQMQTVENDATKKRINCQYCNMAITVTGVQYKDRALHYMRHTTEMHTCPVCLFVLPTSCGLKAHLRFHLKTPPYICPECGVYLSNKSVIYPYNHDCIGFKMMRATARTQCRNAKCSVLHPSEFANHMENHFTKIYKCPHCIVACFDREAVMKHLTSKHAGNKAYLLFFQCALCPGKLILHNDLVFHLKFHSDNFVYPCWTCGKTFEKVSMLLHHHEYKMCKQNSTSSNVPEGADNNFLYRVVKRCDRCKIYFTYRCKYDAISTLPNECPNKCSPGDQAMELCSTQSADKNPDKSTIICFLCKSQVNIDWIDVKKHFEEFHKEHKCLDVSLVLERYNIQPFLQRETEKAALPKVSKKKHKKTSKNLNKFKVKFIQRKKKISKKVSPLLDNMYQCSKCYQSFDDKTELGNHIITHRDPCTAYQCLECGECFVVKPSFALHLLIKHSIADADDYIKNNVCYNEDALKKHNDTNSEKRQLKENQCSICWEEFSNTIDLEKHFRVHGMAFLLKNNGNKTSP